MTLEITHKNVYNKGKLFFTSIDSQLSIQSTYNYLKMREEIKFTIKFLK